MLGLRKKGLAKAIREARDEGKTVIGICGGYQMMGDIVEDPDSIEGELKSLPGLGLLPARTVICRRKQLDKLISASLMMTESAKGTKYTWGVLIQIILLSGLKMGTPEGCMIDEKCWGSYIHGILDNPVVIELILSPFMDPEN